MTPFSRLVAMASEQVVIPEDWAQGRAIFGGVSTALCFCAARAQVDEDRPLRSAQIAFIGPASGPVQARAHILRQGRAASFVASDLIDVTTGQVITRTTFVFGGSRPSQFDEASLPAPPVRPAEDCAPYHRVAEGPSFTRHFDTRLAAGGSPFTGSDARDHTIWARHTDVEANGVAALLGIADIAPPAIGAAFPGPAPLSSMTWQINLLADAPMSESGWWLLHSSVENAQAGYSSQNMGIWDDQGRAVVAGRQSVAIFA